MAREEIIELISARDETLEFIHVHHPLGKDCFQIRRNSKVERSDIHYSILNSAYQQEKNIFLSKRGSTRKDLIPNM